MDFRELLGKKLLFLDGAMGTRLQAKGLKPGETPELWNLSRPDDVAAVHAEYFAAGSNAVYANTFGANRAKFHGDAAMLADVVAAGVGIAKSCAGSAGGGWVGLDVGPTGRLLKPAGDFEFDAAYAAFAEQIAAGAKAGADFVAIETMGDTRELKAAVLAAKENCALPVIATVTLGEDGKLLTGADAEAVAVMLEGLRVDALGLNCGLGPDRMLEQVRRIARCVNLPIAVKPNAGMPQLVGGRTVFTVGPEEFARDVGALIAAGAAIAGGCCGTTPAHIRAVAQLGAELAPRAAVAPRTVVCSGTHAVEISPRDSIVIGERINPTGKKKLRAALSDGDMGYVLREAVAQAEAGAQILDVNVGVPGLDEAAVLDATVQAVQGVTDLPLQIDTADPAALERALRHYNGKALINSVNGKEDSLSAVLPLAAKYGGAVVALALDETGIPPTAEGRIAIARRIIARGAEYGLKPADFVVDALCMAVSAEANSANVVLETLRRVRDELGCATVLGVSNISFGLPARPLLNSAFYTLAMGAGLSAAIVNPLSGEMMAAWRAYRALTGKDAKCESWIGAAQTMSVSVTANANAAATTGAAAESLAHAIRKGLKADAARLAMEQLAAGAAPVEVIDREIVPALEEAGKGFENGAVFLPQLLMAADAAAAAFEKIRAAMPPLESAADARAPFVIATVKGDIHDIGKNICRALAENYGFRVIDLGRDVEPEKVVEAARRANCRLVGLSALMTTTVASMEETIRLVHQELPGCKVTVGGAVVTAEYAKQIGADFYSKDAMGLVRILEKELK